MKIIILPIRKALCILSLLMWAMLFNSCEKKSSDNENNPPVIELIQPQESLVIYADTTVYFEFNISDPDGDITSWTWEIFDQIGEVIWSDSGGTTSQTSFKISSNYEFKIADVGACVMSIVVTENNLEVTEKEFHWDVLDYRDIYLGDWDFQGVRRDWNMNWDPISVESVCSYSGSVDYGSTDSTISVKFCDDPGIDIVITHEGDVHIPPGDYYLSVEFYSADSLYLYKRSTALGAGTEYTLTGVKK